MSFVINLIFWIAVILLIYAIIQYKKRGGTYHGHPPGPIYRMIKSLQESVRRDKERKQYERQIYREEYIAEEARIAARRDARPPKRLSDGLFGKLR